MSTEMGEYIVGAYLKLKRDCDIVDFNVRRPGGGMAGLNELDVMGLNFKTKTAYLCEVTTHLDGLLYGTSKNSTVDRIRNKHEKMMDYAKNHIPNEICSKCHFMFWSPVVSAGLEMELEKIQGLELVINEKYSTCVDELTDQAKRITFNTNNPAFRILQILGHLRRSK